MRENSFKEALLNHSVFPVTWELVPGRGAREASQEKAIALANAGRPWREDTSAYRYRQSGWKPGHVCRFYGQ